MRTWLKVVLIIFLILVVLVGGMVFALRPPYKVIAWQSEAAEFEEAFSSYIEARLEAALNGYSGDGALVVTVDQAGLTQVAADGLKTQVSFLPGSIKYTGMFMNLQEAQIELGAAAKFWIIPVGVSGRFQIEAGEDNLELKLLSTRIGRLPLPHSFALKLISKFLDFSNSQDDLCITVPLDLQGQDVKGVKLVDIEVKPEMLILSVHVEEGVIPEVPDTVRESFNQSIPKIEETIKDNQAAVEIFEDLKEAVGSLEDTEKINPLTLKRLGEELYSSLEDKEKDELYRALDKDLLDYLEQNQE